MDPPKGSGDSPHGWAEVEVRDNGEGIAPEYLNHIFEPFFTTKDVGKGSGLGLSMAYGTVQRHGGEVTVESEPGKGCRFRIRLPLAEPVAAEVVTSDAVQDDGRIYGAGKTILVADDEDVPREVMCKLLERLGYRVVATANGEQALQAFRKHGDDLAAAVMDIVMPQMDGIRAARLIRELNPSFPILFVSGYDLHQQGADVADWPRVELLPKPYRMEELKQRFLNLLG